MDKTSYEFKSATIEANGKGVSVTTQYLIGYTGFRCGTEKPPTKQLNISGNESRILTAEIISPQMLIVKVELNVEPERVEVHLFRL